MENEEKIQGASEEVNRHAKLIKLGAIILVLIFLCLFIMFSYVDIQRLFYAPENILLFVDSYEIYNHIIYLICFSPLMVFILFHLSESIFVNRGNSKLENYIYKLLSSPKSVAIISIVTLLLCLSVLFNNYSYVDNHGIFVKRDMFSKQKHYDFSQIDHIEVKTEYGRTRGTYRDLFVRYNFYFKDQTILNIASSFEFWNKVNEIEVLIASNEIKINREVIDDEKCLKLISTYDYLKDLRNLVTLEKIFEYKTTIISLKKSENKIWRRNLGTEASQQGVPVT